MLLAGAGCNCSSLACHRRLPPAARRYRPSVAELRDKKKWELRRRNDRDAAKQSLRRKTKRSGGHRFIFVKKRIRVMGLGQIFMVVRGPHGPHCSSVPGTPRSYGKGCWGRGRERKKIHSSHTHTPTNIKTNGEPKQMRTNSLKIKR